LENAVFSYTPSARMLCRSAKASEIPLTDGGLVLGDPDTGDTHLALPAARAEALAVRQEFYPAARYFGQDATGRPAEQGGGTPAEVLAWLADPTGGPLVHAACHSMVTGSDLDRTSYLLLANGHHLSAEDLTAALSANTDRDLALAVLASCRSAESGKGYDEAFSLATVFLAGGTRSVISTQWSIPDAPTSILMYLFHHHLRTGNLRPADALREAQLNMITETLPRELPPSLAGTLTGMSTANPTTWAAFTHSGR
jgi:CHAT domain-containing protein